MIGTLKKIIRKNDYSLDEDEISAIAEDYVEKIENGKFDFSLATQKTLTQGSKKRCIYSFNNNSVEHVLCGYLKEILDQNFLVKYSSRSKVMNMLFNTLPVVKDLNDFVVVRFDFKSFFDSVSTKFIYKKYIETSSIPRGIKKTFDLLCMNFNYCFAGLNTSNAMTEIACRDFDKVLRAKLEVYGVVYCQRYVDDVLVILNSYISEEEFLRLLNDAIAEVFFYCKVKINDSKFNYIARRNIKKTQSFDFLGYNFTIEFTSSKKRQFNFKFGITASKQKKYKDKIRQSFIEYRLNGNTELLRHRIKAFSSRIVYTFPLNSDNYDWIAKGIIANYNELRYHMNDLDKSTEEFLRNVYFDIMKELGITREPYFFNKNDEESCYNLYSTMKRNRSMIFDPKIGIKINQLVYVIRKIKPSYVANKRTYYQITKEYLDALKIQ